MPRQTSEQKAGQREEWKEYVDKVHGAFHEKVGEIAPLLKHLHSARTYPSSTTATDRLIGRYDHWFKKVHKMRHEFYATKHKHKPAYNEQMVEELAAWTAEVHRHLITLAKKGNAGAAGIRLTGDMLEKHLASIEELREIITNAPKK